MKFSIKLKLMEGFGVALLLMIMMGAVSFNSTVSLANASTTMHRTHEVIDLRRNVGIESAIKAIDGPAYKIRSWMQ